MKEHLISDHQSLVEMTLETQENMTDVPFTLGTQAGCPAALQAPALIPALLACAVPRTAKNMLLYNVASTSHSTLLRLSSYHISGRRGGPPQAAHGRRSSSHGRE